MHAYSSRGLRIPIRRREITAALPRALACAFILLLLQASSATAQIAGYFTEIVGKNTAALDSPTALTGPDKRTVMRAYEEGIELLQEGNCARAAKKFKMVLGHAGNDPQANYMAGTAARCQGDFEGAAKRYERAIDGAPEMYVAYKNLGFSYVAMREPDRAFELLASLEVIRIECADDCPVQLKDAFDGLAAVLKPKAAE